MMALSPAAPVPARGVPCGRLATALAIAALVVGVSLPVQAASPLVVLTPGEPGDGATRFAERLRDALAASRETTLQPAEGGPAVLARVLADPTHVAFAQRDALATFGRADRQAGQSLEIYGSVPACVVTLVRPVTNIRSFADVSGARRDGEPITIDVGAPGSWPASTFSILRELDATIAHFTPEHRGGARALSRVLAGETDALLAIAYDGTLDEPLAEAVASGALTPVPLLGTAVVRVAALHSLPYESNEIEIGRAGWLRTARPYDTICTSLGVVVNTRAEPKAAEAIARIAVTGRLTATNRGWLRETLGYAGDTVARTAAEAQRAASSIVEPAFAWISRVVLPADPNGRKTGVRPASNLKDDAL